MSIQTELARLTNAKAAIQAAIEGKGVTVPDGTLLDGMAAMIEAIEAGGGDSGTKLEISTITPSEKIYESNKLTVTHGLGAIPKFVAVMTTDAIKSSSFGVRFSAIYLPNRFVAGDYNKYYTTSAYYGSSWKVYVNTGNSNSDTFDDLVNSAGSPINDATDSNITLCGLRNNSIAGLLAGNTYFLFIGG